MKTEWEEELDNRLKPLLKRALGEGLFSGVAAGVYRFGKEGGIRYVLTMGKTRGDLAGKAIDKKTFFDLASLTKPLCTALGILCLIERKEIKAGSKVSHILPYTPISENIDVEHLLTHSSGFIAYKPLYKLFAPKVEPNTKEQIIQLFLQEQLCYERGKESLYSDVGYILLGEIIETISGMPLDEFFTKFVAEPIKIKNQLLFLRITGCREKKIDYVATEHCHWRGRLIQGEVHDEHAWLMDGVSGHAGLFGTIEGVMEITEHLLHQWKGRLGHPHFSTQLLHTALSVKNRGKGTWCWGFDTPAPVNSSAGKFFNARSVGHLGFTGTSFWIDPEQEIIITLLSNRIHPTRANEGIKRFRPLFHDTVMEVFRE